METETLLEKACREGEERDVWKLLSKKHKVTEKAVQYACKSYPIIAQMLLSNTCPPLSSDTLCIACKHSCFLVVKLLIESGCQMTSKSFETACKYSTANVISLLLKSGCQTSAKGFNTLCMSLPYEASDRIIMNDSLRKVRYATTPYERVKVRDAFIEIILQLVKSGCEYNPKMLKQMAVVASNCNLVEPIIRCMIERGTIVTPEVLEELCICRDSNLAISLVSSRIELTSKMLERAAGHPTDKQLVECLVDNKCPISSFAVKRLLTANECDLAVHLVKNGCPLEEELFHHWTLTSFDMNSYVLLNTLIQLGCPKPSSALSCILHKIREIEMRRITSRINDVQTMMSAAERLILNGCTIDKDVLLIMCEHFPTLFDMMYDIHNVHTSPQLLETAAEVGDVSQVKKLLNLNCPYDNSLIEFLQQIMTNIYNTKIAKYQTILQLLIAKEINTSTQFIHPNLVEIIASYV
jgi:hypothetical protein